MKHLALMLIASTAMAGAATARAEAGIFDEAIPLPDGRIAVVAEASREPRSIGSYSVRLYGARNETYPFDDFVSGTIQPRDGTVYTVTLDDVDSNGVIDLIVIMVSAGSGSYRSADAFGFKADGIELLGHVEGLSPGDDVLAALKRAIGAS